MAQVGSNLALSCSKLGAKWLKSAPSWPKLAPSWSKFGSSDPQVGSKLVEVGPKLAKDCIKAVIPKTYNFVMKNIEFCMYPVVRLGPKW